LLDTPVAGNFILTADCASVNNPGSWDNFNLIFGYQDANNFYYVNAAESANGYWNGLYKVVGGVTTRLTVWTTPFTPGTVYTMKVQRVGQSILVYRAGALVASVPDTTFPAGKVGFGTSQPTSGAKLAQFSNVTLTQNDLLAVEQDFSGGAGDFTVAQGTWAVNAGHYQVTSLGSDIRAASLALLPPLGADDFTVMADGVIVNSPSSWDNLNIVFNYQDINNYYCVNIAESDNTAWNGIFKVQGGVATAIANWTTTFPPGVTYTLKVVKSGSSIQAYSNNVLLGTATDATFSGGQIGFGTSQTTTGSKTALFDNIVVFPPPDDF
ncbi:MAG TPA: hypothetical protein VIM58_07525, partial [Candidatus Methylacidiphilales bacterium]